MPTSSSFPTSVDDDEQPAAPLFTIVLPDSALHPARSLALDPTGQTLLLSPDHTKEGFKASAYGILKEYYPSTFCGVLGNWSCYAKKLEPTTLLWVQGPALTNSNGNTTSLPLNKLKAIVWKPDQSRKSQSNVETSHVQLLFENEQDPASAPGWSKFLLSSVGSGKLNLPNSEGDSFTSDFQSAFSQVKGSINVTIEAETSRAVTCDLKAETWWFGRFSFFETSSDQYILGPAFAHKEINEPGMDFLTSYNM